MAVAIIASIVERDNIIGKVILGRFWGLIFPGIGGAPGFFKPRLPPPFFYPPGSVEALSFYDVALLKATLGRLVDFDLINAGPTRFSVGAVNVRTGNFVYFDNTKAPPEVLQRPNSEDGVFTFDLARDGRE